MRGYLTLCQHSEMTKNDLNDLLKVLNSWGAFDFIFGPTLAHSDGHLTEILSIHIWLYSASRVHKMDSVDICNLFWNSPSFSELRPFSSKFKLGLCTSDL